MEAVFLRFSDDLPLSLPDFADDEFSVLADPIFFLEGDGVCFGVPGDVLREDFPGDPEGLVALCLGLSESMVLGVFVF